MTQAIPNSIPCPLKAQLSQRPDAPAIYYRATHAPLSYRELDLQVSAINLTQMTAGEALAVILDEPLQLIVWLLACMRSGVIFCPINPIFSDQEIEQRCQEAGIDYYISAQERCFTKLTKLTLDSHPAKNAADFPLAQPVTLIFTSGSSGQPKAAQHSLSNHYYSALGSQQLIPFEQTDCWLLSLPLFHMGGIALVFRAFFAGGSVALGTKSILNDLMDFPVTHASLVPTQVYRLLQHKQPPSRLRYLLVGGAALNNTLISKLAEQPYQSFASYGLTEMSSQVATVKLNKHTQQPLSYEILPYRQVRINNQAIMLSGPCLFMGYRQQGRLQPTPSPFNSKDCGYLGMQGLQVTGRLDNMFIAGGENVQPEQVEQILGSFDLVKQAIVVPISDPEFGQVAVAYIDWYEDIELESLTQLCQQQLPPWQRPKHFLAWPQWQGLKPNRKTLQRQAEQILTNS